MSAGDGTGAAIIVSSDGSERRVNVGDEIKLKPEILDACCGGRHWWWDKAHPLAVYMDKRVAPPGSNPHRDKWSCEPSVVGDFREMPFGDGEFQLVLFDPPHIVSDSSSGVINMQYGTLSPATGTDDLGRGFQECWRVLAPGGTLIFKWAGPVERVKPLFPATPIVGTRAERKFKGMGTRWFVFYKPLNETETELRLAV